MFDFPTIGMDAQDFSDGRRQFSAQVDVWKRKADSR